MSDQRNHRQRMDFHRFQNKLSYLLFPPLFHRKLDNRRIRLTNFHPLYIPFQTRWWFLVRSYVTIVQFVTGQFPMSWIAWQQEWKRVSRVRVLLTNHMWTLWAHTFSSLLWQVVSLKKSKDKQLTNYLKSPSSLSSLTTTPTIGVNISLSIIAPTIK